jgi:predicted transcriptional regulator
MESFDRNQRNRQVQDGESKKSGIPFQKPRPERFRNRSRLSLIANLLAVASEGVTRTQLIYKANLSHRMLKDYISFLIDRGLIELYESENGKRVLYRTSQLGRKYLEAYSSLIELANIKASEPMLSSVTQSQEEKNNNFFSTTTI